MAHADAGTNTLAGAASRPAFDEALDRESHRSERAGISVCLALIEFDYAEPFVEQYGSAALTHALTQIAAVAASRAARGTDLVAHYSAHQFGVLLPFTDQRGAVIVAERIRQAVDDLAIPNAGSPLGRVTVSAGVTGGLLPAVGAASEWLQLAQELGGHRVCAEGYESAAAPQSVPAATNLPQPRTSFIGRAQDVASVCEIMTAERALTLLGAGGTGKTRTAIEAARTLSGQFPDGVWFLDLAAVNDLSAMLVFIASVAGLGAVRSDSTDEFASRLAGRRMLFVLDNCEHIIQPCRVLSEALLGNTAHVKMLLTSREALKIAGERVYRLPMLAQEDAEQLFLDRALQAGVDASQHTEIVERIVRRLDGMPLAIELAAARLPMMSAEDLLVSLDDALSVLRDTGGGLPTRQQTVRALIDWSYRLLDEREQRLFRRLAVFPSGWDLEAIEPVTGETAETLEALVSKSLVQRNDDGGHARFRFLHVTRGYAETFLKGAGEHEQVLDNLCVYFSGLASIRGLQLAHITMREWLRVQAPDRENYTLALQYALEHPARQDRAESMLESMRHWFHERGTVDFRGLLPLLESLQERGALLESVLAPVSLAAADLYGTRDLRRARDSAERALKLYREVDDGLGAAHALERLASAQRYLEGGVDKNLETPIRNGIFTAKRNGDNRLAAMLLRIVSDIYALRKDTVNERASLVEAYELLRACGDEDRSGGVLGRLAVAAFWNGDYEEARDTCRTAIVLLEKAGEPWNLAFHVMNLGLFEISRNDYGAARAALARSLELLRRYGHEYAVANTFTYYAMLARRLELYEPSIRLLGYADVLFESGPRQQLRLQRLHDELLHELQPLPAFDQHWRAGRSMSWEQALAEAGRV